MQPDLLSQPEPQQIHHSHSRPSAFHGKDLPHAISEPKRRPLGLGAVDQGQHEL